MRHTLLMAGTIAGLFLCIAGSPEGRAQTKGGAAKKGIPRTADGHPDLSGVWWRGSDVGGNSGPSATRLPPGGNAPSFASLYNAEAQAKVKTLGDKDDPTLHCLPTAFGTVGVSMFDVGAVAQIVQSPKFVIMLSETFHGWQIIPIDGRPHRDVVPPSYRGDSIGRWDGDTLVVDKTNFTDQNWISAEGRVSFHSDQLHIVERYTRIDANTLEIEATLEDPEVLTKPWVAPKMVLTLAPFDQIMELQCTGVETGSLIEAAAELNANAK